MRGPKPKPTSQKIREGNPGRRPLNAEEPKPEVAGPECPPSLPEPARRRWKELVEEMTELGMISRLDFGTLYAHCAAFARREKAERRIATQGEVIETDFGPKKNPWVTIQKDMDAIILKSAAELGLTATSRTRIKVSPQKSRDKFDEFQKRRASIHVLEGRKTNRGNAG